MRGLWIVVLPMTACIESVDPNECGLDVDCDGGRVCNAMRRCARIEDVRDLTVRWTIDGVTPIPAMPGGCSEVTSFAIGASSGGSGYIESVTCANGAAPLLRVPRELTTVSAWAYRSIGNGNVSVVGEASAPLPVVGDVVTIDVVLQ